MKFKTRVKRSAKKAGAKTKEHLRKNLIERFAHVRQVRLLVLEWVLLIAAMICLAIIQTISYQNSYTVTAAGDGGTYTEATIGEITSLNPLYASTSTETTLAKLMFATLTRVDTSGNIGLGLASSLKPTDSTGKTWRLTLRDDLKWSDGEPITLDDVMFTIEVIQSNATNTSYESNLSGVKATKVDDEDGEAIVFTLPSAYADFPSSLEIPIIPEHAFEGVEISQILQSDFSSKPITSGAFTYTATQVPENNLDGSGVLATVYLAANPNYYLGKPKINTFAVTAYSTTDEIISALNAGTVSGTAALEASAESQITNTNIYLRTTAVNSGVFIFLNTDSTALKTRSLRQAVAAGIDVSLVRELAADTTALDYPLLSSQIELTNWPELHAYDPDSAREKLSGVTSEALNLVTVNSGELPAVAENVAEQLRDLGLEVNVTAYEPGQDFLVNVIGAKNYDILIYEIDLGVEADLFAYYHSSQASSTGLNLSNYKNAISDELLLSARTTLDSNARITALETFLKQWVNDVPAIGLYQTNSAYFYNKTTQNFATENQLTSDLDRFADVQDWSATEEIVYRTP